MSSAGSSSSIRAFVAGPHQVSPLSASEEADPALLQIARRFNPAMAMPIREIWPVELGYAWHDGADLMAHVDGDDARDDRVAVRSADLQRVDWSRLPTQTDDGRAIRYYIDAPGDDGINPGTGKSHWRERFAAIAQPGGDLARPTDSPYRPTQYVHAYWWNRAKGLLALQYWFYYPYNEWVNHHEGDWEHIEIIVKGPAHIDAGARYTPVAHHYFFHDFWIAPTEVVRFAGTTPGEDHAMVHVGGQGTWFGYGGAFSGGSYPMPGRYPAAGFSTRWLSPEEDTSKAARFLAASEFQLIILPEPERLDVRRSPALSWLRLPFYVGQWRVHRNPPGMDDWVGRPPLQPAARSEWLTPAGKQLWRGEVAVERPNTGAHWPASWKCAETVNPTSCLPTQKDEPRVAGLAARAF